MARPLRRLRRPRPVRTWAAIGAALLVHVTVLGTTSALGFSTEAPHSHRHAAARPAPPELRASCIGDAVLAAGARGALCAAPWRDDQGACADTLQTDLLIDISTCQAMNDPSTAVAFVSQRASERVKAIDPAQLLADAKPKATPPPPPPPPQVAVAEVKPPPPPPPAPARAAQVVETVKPTTEVAPDNARFLSEFDTAVKHQTVARGAKSEPLVAKSQPEELTAKQQPREATADHPPDLAPGANAHAPDVPGTLSMRNPGARSPAALAQEAKTRGDTSISPTQVASADGLSPRHGDGALEQQHHDATEPTLGQGGAGGGAPRVPDLKPSQDVLERALGGGSVDHLDDIDNGDETALSSKKWIYASFFNRLKRQVAQNWDPASVWRANDPTGSHNGTKTRVTGVRVSLTPSGALHNIVVTDPCGVPELDDEAVRAFRASAPFVNPPEGLVASDKLITFGFAFYFEVGAPRSSWRVQRSM